MATEKTPNYTPEQESIILGWNNGGPLSFDDATAIAADPRMNDADGNARKPRSITAKISRLCPERYAKKVPLRKDGSTVRSKAQLVADIAAAVGVEASALDTLDKSGRDDLVTLRDAIERLAA